MMRRGDGVSEGGRKGIGRDPRREEWIAKVLLSDGFVVN